MNKINQAFQEYRNLDIYLDHYVGELHDPDFSIGISMDYHIFSDNIETGLLDLKIVSFYDR